MIATTASEHETVTVLDANTTTVYNLLGKR